MQPDGSALTALADPTRRAIFEHLGAHPSAVGELAEHLPVSRPAVSQHLKVLKEAGLVLEQRDGTRHVFRLNPEGIAEARDYLERFWTVSLASFKHKVESNPPKKRASKRKERP